MTSPTEPEFAVFPRGYFRELVLACQRNGLRSRIDPDTGQLFTESKIRRVTQEGSRFYVEADADDLICLSGTKRAEFLSQQISHDRAGHSFLVNRHAVTWGERFLPGFSAVGTVLAKANPGVSFVGSTTVPSELATFGVDPAGNRFQVYIGGTADANGEVSLTLASIDVGDQTNIASGTKITWSNPPVGSAPFATATTVFAGGFPPEDDAAFVSRLGSRIRRKPAAGNAPQIRAWAREASVGVEDAFVYPAAFNAGSLLVVPTQKRGSTVGPNARIATLAILTAVRDRIVPPGSPVMPPQTHVLVVPAVAHATNITLLAAFAKGGVTGWADVQPFPTSRGALDAVTITTVTTQTNIVVTSGAAGQLPNGVAGPLAGVSLMVWNPTSSSFEQLHVSTVTDTGSGHYHVILSQAPAKTLATGDYISPYSARSIQLASGIQAYFDSLGPGEVVNLSTDMRGFTAFRRPIPSEEFPARAGQSVITFLLEALGSALADASLDVISVSTPSIPTDPASGPELITVGKVCVLPLD